MTNTTTPATPDGLAACPLDPIHDFTQDYAFEFSGGQTYTPTDAERAMLEDAINQWEAQRG
jgi:hypothetical protein